MSKGNRIRSQMNNTIPQQHQVQMTPEILAKCDDVLCVNCNGSYFREAIRFKKVSAILSQTGQEGMLQFVALVCVNCGVPLNDDVPFKEELSRGGAGSSS